MSYVKGSSLIKYKLDPEIRLFVNAILEGYSRFETDAVLTLAQSRENAEIVRECWTQGGPAMARVADHLVTIKGQALKIRIYDPNIEEAQPAMIYLHGGGWALFSLDTHDRLMREYAQRASIKIIGVEYSLAPESKFPHQIGEICEVVHWLRENGSQFGIDTERLAIGGDSAGGNLSVATCLKLRDEGNPYWIKAMLLNYGAFIADVSSASHDRFSGDRFLLTTEEKIMFWDYYLAQDEDARNPMASTLLADLHSLPATYMVIASHDILYDENIAMAEKMTAAGVPVEAIVYPGTAHSFLEAVSIARVSDQALSESSAWLRNSLYGRNTNSQQD